MSALFLSPANVAAELNDPNSCIIDLGDEHRYQQQHIPNARYLPFSALVSSQPPAAGLMPNAKAFSAALAAIGVGAQSRVIAYDDAGGGKAGRLVFTLHALGFFNVAILDGGWNAWLAAGQATSDQTPTAIPATDAIANSYSDATNIADQQWILDHLDDSNVVLLDTRSADEYSGESVRAARGGHIPGAIHFEWTDAMNMRNQQALRPLNDIAAELSQLGVSKDQEVVVYCQTHHRSAHTYALLKQLGYRKVRGYPGAWSDWGNSSETPVVTGTAAR